MLITTNSYHYKQKHLVAEDSAFKWPLPIKSWETFNKQKNRSENFNWQYQYKCF